MLSITVGKRLLIKDIKPYFPSAPANESFDVSGLIASISALAARAYSAHIGLQMKLLAGIDLQACARERVLECSSC